jgi:dephospho-CoA kinase
LTGGIGSGKSSAGGVFARLGADVISADEAGRATLEPDGEAFAAVAERWPEVIVDDRVDRAALAGIVFSDRDELAALEALTHPAIRSRIAAALDRSASPLVLVEVPILTVFGDTWPVMVVDAPVETRIERLRGRGMSDDDIQARLASQPTRGEWLTAADVVVDNSGGMEDLEAECRFVWEWVRRL